MVLANQYERKTLIVAQQDVIGRAKPLDQLRFEQQRLRLARRNHNFHRPRLRDHPLQALRQTRELHIGRHAMTQRARLADIEHIAAHIDHAIDAGNRFQRPDDRFDGRSARFKVWPFAAAHTIGGAFLVKTVRGSGIINCHGSCHSRVGR